MAGLSRCERVMYFESRSGQDFYLWFSTNIAGGPSAKFRVFNVHTMSELNFTGNCLKYSRPILSFDPAFESEPHMQPLKEMLTQMFYVPENHPKSKPYFDHIINFGLTPDRRIWIRFYAIPAGNIDIEVEEIGPRFVLELIRVLSGSFEGDVLYNNQQYIS
uniref:Ribosome biogenesis protein BRX1 homolog n=1 Tax=Panagrolaimus sp. PS1159 TaxID=55785 RepID=A0AC35GI43_9BILA